MAAVEENAFVTYNFQVLVGLLNCGLNKAPRVGSPETATAYGDYRYNDRLNDYSLKGAQAQNLVDRSYRAKLAAISTEGFPEQDRISHDLLLHELDDRIRAARAIILSKSTRCRSPR